MYNYIDKFFNISQTGSTIRTEIVAGATTFLAMSYIVVVNPAILSQAGMDFGAVFVATCLAAAFGCILMGVITNYPIGLAPGMGQNAFFTYGIVLGSGHSWQAALGAVFISGLLFILISVLPIRSWIINAIPKNLKIGISAGIGLFIAFIALKKCWNRRCKSRHIGCVWRFNSVRLHHGIDWPLFDCSSRIVRIQRRDYSWNDNRLYSRLAGGRSRV